MFNLKSVRIVGFALLAALPATAFAQTATSNVDLGVSAVTQGSRFIGLPGATSTANDCVVPVWIFGRVDQACAARKDLPWVERYLGFQTAGEHLVEHNPRVQKTLINQQLRQRNNALARQVQQHEDYLEVMTDQGVLARIRGARKDNYLKGFTTYFVIDGMRYSASR